MILKKIIFLKGIEPGDSYKKNSYKKRCVESVVAVLRCSVCLATI